MQLGRPIAHVGENQAVESEPCMQENISVAAGVADRGLNFCMRRSGLGLAPGAAAVVTNGRLIRLDSGEPLVAEDFQLLSLYADSAQAAQKARHGRLFGC